MQKQTEESSRWVLVTGGSRGIGSGIVEALAAEGYLVVFTYQSSGEAAERLEREVTARGGFAHGIQCDGRDPAAVESVCAQLIERFGEPYGLINNMGITGDQLMFNLDIKRYRDVVATNLDSAIYFSRFMSSAMVPARQGRIIQMSSVTGLKGNKGQVGYAATKAAMIGMTRTLAVELARFKITVNAIAPGFIATEMVEQMDPAIRRSIIASIPLKRLGTVSEVAALASFLLSSNAGYLTGQTFVIDGGLTA